MIEHNLERDYREIFSIIKENVSKDLFDLTALRYFLILLSFSRNLRSKCFMDPEKLRQYAAAIPMAAFVDDKESFLRVFDFPRAIPISIADVSESRPQKEKDPKPSKQEPI